MTTIVLFLKNLEASMAFGRHLGAAATAGDVITLGGSLGAGKTTLTQAIGQGLEVPTDQYITSPTYSLLHVYLGRLPLFHMDLYRLAGEEEIEELGFEDYIYGNGLTVIEWPDRLGTLMPADRLHIELTSGPENARRAKLTSHGDSWRERVSSMLKRAEWTPEKLTD